MEFGNLIERICRLPSDFHDGSKSAFQILCDSGLSNQAPRINADSVAAYIDRHPQIIEQWLQWSADKRTTSGWYFVNSAGVYIVGFHPNGETSEIRNPSVACAEYIIREVYSIIAPQHA